MGLKLSCKVGSTSKIYRRNRTIMGLKLFVSSLFTLRLLWSQSNHYGIETFVCDFWDLTFIKSQSNHYGIETKGEGGCRGGGGESRNRTIMGLKLSIFINTEGGKGSQSNHYGIETLPFSRSDLAILSSQSNHYGIETFEILVHMSNL